jgi:hypothetical protein
MNILDRTNSAHWINKDYVRKEFIKAAEIQLMEKQLNQLLKWIEDQTNSEWYQEKKELIKEIKRLLQQFEKYQTKHYGITVSTMLEIIPKINLLRKNWPEVKNICESLSKEAIALEIIDKIKNPYRLHVKTIVGDAFSKIIDGDKVNIIGRTMLPLPPQLSAATSRAHLIISEITKWRKNYTISINSSNKTAIMHTGKIFERREGSTMPSEIYFKRRSDNKVINSKVGEQMEVYLIYRDYTTGEDKMKGIFSFKITKPKETIVHFFDLKK